MNYQGTFAGPVVETMAQACEPGHTWQPTIIIGYFQCSRCSTLAACHLCVSKVRGKPLLGVCQQHQHLSIPTTQQEVLS